MNYFFSVVCCLFLCLEPLFGSAARYLDDALKIIEEGSVNRNRIDREQVRRKVFEKAKDAQVPQDTYDAIRLALSLLNDNHSFFYTPEQANILKFQNDETTCSLIASQAVQINAHIGYLLVPSFAPLSGNAVTQYAQSLQDQIKSLEQRGVYKWIIDLRGNIGGNSWPMLLGLGPLFGSNLIGYFSDGTEQYPWIYEDGSLKNGEFLLCKLDQPAYKLKHPDPFVAVLVDSETASSGEVTLTAFLGRDRTKVFGQKTAGYTSANELFELCDGALILLSTTYIADRLGRIYESGITPDEVIPEEGETVLNAAMKWLQ